MKVTYSTIRSGTWLGVVVSEGRDLLGEYYNVKVTSRNNPHYRAGEIVPIAKNSPWLKERA